MANLTHLFDVGQKVVCKTEIGMKPGTVTETYEDHIIVDVPSISEHMWYEEGWNIGDVFPDYNFIDKDPLDKPATQISPYDVYKMSELF